MLAAIIDTLQIVLLILLGLPLLYILMLSILAVFAQLQTSFPAITLRRFAIVVPAHNEESAIARTVESLLRIDYPRDRFDVIVIADNCTDKTASIATGLGATVFERTNLTERGKGYALRWCFDKLLTQNRTLEAIIVIDADSIASSNYLAVLNYYLEQGARALQSSDLVEPQPGAWSAEATRLGFALYNYVRPLGRRMIGGHVGPRGNGMCFTVDVLRLVPWNAFTQSEDLEYGLNLLLHGIAVEFAPEAVVLATMPSSAKNAESQRSRWEAGRFPVVKRYAGKLLAAVITRRSLLLFDAFVDLVVPSLVNLIAFSLVMSFLSIVLSLTSITGSAYGVLWLGLTGAGILHMFVGVWAAGGDQSLIRTILYIPRYAAWKLLLYLRLIKKGHTQEWVRTTREKVP